MRNPVCSALAWSGHCVPRARHAVSGQALLFLCVVAWVGGCTSSSVSPPRPDAGPDASTDLTVAPDLPALDRDALRLQFCEPLAALRCEWFESCGCDVLVVNDGIDRVRCEAVLTAECVLETAAVVPDTARFDAARADACLALVRARNPICRPLDMRIIGGLCEPFLAEPVAIGERCVAGICADGFGYCAEGVCRERSGAPQPCYGSEVCRSGLVCVRGLCAPLTPESVRGCIGDEDCEPALVCVDGLCARPGEDRARCFEDNDCAFRSTCVRGECVARVSECAGGAEACGGNAGCGGAWTCEPRASAGERCGWLHWTRDCAPDLYCGDDFRCEPRRHAGESCGPGTLCLSGLACSGLAFSEGVCLVPPGLGSPCFGGEFGPVECAAGLACLDGTCARTPTDGEKCSDDRRCATELTCGLGTDGFARCGPPRLEGERCLPGACAEPLVCTGIDSVCTPPRGPGEPCPTQSECGGACVRSSNTLLACANTGSLGQPCFSHEDCALDLHCTIANPVCIASVCPPF